MALLNSNQKAVLAHRAASARISSIYYRPHLDGIRTFCIIFTILNHIAGVPFWINGTIGVDIFFALSGWLITSLLLSEWEWTQRISLSQFYVRRIFRIIPLYILTIAIYFALTSAGMKSSGALEFRSAFPYMITFNMEYRPLVAGSLFGHAWTLGIEEKFYLIWPIILVCTIQRPLISAVIAAACVATLTVALGLNDMIIRGYFGLGLGATLAMLTHHRPPIADWLSRRGIAIHCFLFMVPLYLASVFYPMPSIWNVAIAICATGGIASLWYNEDQIVRSLLAWGPLPWLGRLTYAIYLIQSICIRAVEVVLAKLDVNVGPLISFLLVYAVCVLTAWIAHITIEKPFIQWGKRFAGRLQRDGAAAKATAGSSVAAITLNS